MLITIVLREVFQVLITIVLIVVIISLIAINNGKCVHHDCIDGADNIGNGDDDFIAVFVIR